MTDLMKKYNIEYEDGTESEAYDEDMGYGTFLFWCLALFASANMLYNRFLFVPMPGLSRYQSHFVLLLMASLAALFCCIYKGVRHRSAFAGVVSLIPPFGIYALFSYRKQFPNTVWLLLGAVLIMLCGYVCLLFANPQHSKNPDKERRLIKKRIDRAWRSTKTMSICCLVLILGYLSVGQAFDCFLFSPDTALAATVTEESIAESHKKELAKTDEETWETLSSDEKVKILQIVADIEQQHLGLPHKLTVRVTKMPKNTMGFYRDSDHTIHIGPKFINQSTAHTLISTVCHEAYHAYEHRLCEVYQTVSPDRTDLLAFRKIAQYQKEFANYTKASDENVEAYRAQACEEDAREYERTETWRLKLDVF